MSTSTSTKHSGEDHHDLGTVPQKPDSRPVVEIDATQDREIATMPTTSDVNPSTHSGREAWKILGIVSLLAFGAWVGLKFKRSNGVGSHHAEIMERAVSLERALEQAHSQRAAAERKIEEFEGKLGLVASDREQIEEDRLADTRKELADAKADARAAADALEQTMNKFKDLQAKLENATSEIRLLKSQITPSSPHKAEPVDSIPAIPAGDYASGSVFRVRGLIAGDTLNMRSGPGSTYSVLIRLANGVRVTATGNGVANGDELWLPCFIRTSPPVPSSSTNSPPQPQSQLRGWVNYAFLEEVSANDR